jgi:hypothetical protein
MINFNKYGLYEMDQDIGYLLECPINHRIILKMIGYPTSKFGTS